MVAFDFGEAFLRWTAGFYALSCWKTEKPFTTHFLTVGLKTMKAKYFQDTDTLYLELRDSEVVDTRDLDSDTILDYDAEGNVVGITLEHAKSKIGGERMELEMVSV